jgi:hypothetical protein
MKPGGQIKEYRHFKEPRQAARAITKCRIAAIMFEQKVQ